LQVAPSTYYAAKSRSSSARSIRDEELKDEIMRVFGENFYVYGALRRVSAKPALGQYH
jgi:putative transposase